MFFSKKPRSSKAAAVVLAKEDNCRIHLRGMSKNKALSLMKKSI